MEDRICKIEGCFNLGRPNHKWGYRDPKCSQCYSGRTPEIRELVLQKNKEKEALRAQQEIERIDSWMKVDALRHEERKITVEAEIQYRNEIAEGFKKCLRCFEVKPLEEFYNRSERLSKRSFCRDCVVSERRAQKALKLGWTEERFLMFNYAQGGFCCLCGEPGYGRRLSRDHNHETGSPRGLICASCNSGLGYFYENPLILEAAAQYLRIYGASG